MKHVQLPHSHYAAKWPADSIRTTQEVTNMGLAYHVLPECDEKGQKLLEILQCFHGYLTKYMGMILMGHISFRAGTVNKDTELMLRCFVPKGKTINRATLGQACRTLHLAFKGMDQGEVYDVLMMQMVRAINGWDPKYHEKIQAVVKFLDEKFEYERFVSREVVDKNLGLDCTRYVRVLVKRGYLVEAGTKGVLPGVQPAAWPPPEEFLQPTKPVGLVYYATKWSRYYLTDWIIWRMGELESREGVLQLDHRSNATPKPPRSGENVWDPAIPHADGDFTIATSGKSVAADVSMKHLPLDVGIMDFDWVLNKSDGFFGNLSVKDRQLLYCFFAREMDWDSISSQHGEYDQGEFHDQILSALNELRKDQAEALGELKTNVAVVVNETRNVVTRLDKVNGSIARHELKIADLGTDLAKSVADSLLAASKAAGLATAVVTAHVTDCPLHARMNSVENYVTGKLATTASNSHWMNRLWPMIYAMCGILFYLLLMNATQILEAIHLKHSG